MARARYKIKNNFQINDVDLKGVIVVDLGPCAFGGRTATKGKKLLKGDSTHRKFKFEDAKVAKKLGISKSLATFAIVNEHIGTALEKLPKG